MKRGWSAPWGLKLEWVKHYCNAERSELLTAVIRDMGFEGYGRYWRLLEYLGKEFDGESTTFRIPAENFRELLRFRSVTGARMFIEWFATFPGSVSDQSATGPGLIGKQSGNVFEIEAPILLDLLGRDFRVARKHRAETAPKNKIKNKKKIKSNTYAQTGAEAPVLDLELLYKAYPRKQGKAVGLNKLKTIIKTTGDWDRFHAAVLRFCEVMKKEARPADKVPYFSTFVSQHWTDYTDENVGINQGFESAIGQYSEADLLRIATGGKNAAQ